jgi:hypothetical protein
MWEAEDVTVALSKDGAARGSHAHPATVSEEWLVSVLSWIQYSRYEYFEWTPPVRVFDDQVVRSLAPALRAAFAAAGPEEIVEMSATERGQSPFPLTLGEARLTKAEAFVDDGSLRFRFAYVRKVMNQDSAEPGETESDRFLVAWKLVPAEGQRCDDARGSAEGKNEACHSIAVPVQAASATAATAQPPAAPVPTPSAVAPIPAAAPPPAAPPAPQTLPSDPAAVTKLRQLKQMLDEGLITPQDYQRKKEEILSGF